MNSTDKSVFNVGDAVVYPMQGVGFILARETRREKEYYRVQISASDMDVLLPVDNASALGLRHLASATEAKKAISSLSERRETRGLDWKQRLLMNQELMKEEQRKEVEADFELAIQKGRRYGMEDKEFREILELILEE